MNQKDYVYKTFGDGRVAEATIYWKERDSSAHNPVALIFHGGGFVIGTRSMVSLQQVKDLVDTGFVVVSADYTLCPQASLYNGPLRDARDAYAWCKKELARLMEIERVKIDPARIATLGYSAGATLALCLAAEPEPPVAVLDFYGAKYFKNPFWFAPLPALAGIPDFDPSFLDKIFAEPALTTTGTSLERMSNKVSDGNEKPKSGMPMPDFTKPRNAWLFSKLKHGTHLSEIVQDGDYNRVDPVTAFSKSFPPVFFIHGAADNMILPEFSEQACSELKALGVETELAIVPDSGHGFDIGLSVDHPNYQFILQGIKFLGRHAKVEA